MERRAEWSAHQLLAGTHEQHAKRRHRRALARSCRATSHLRISGPRIRMETDTRSTSRRGGRRLRSRGPQKPARLPSPRGAAAKCHGDRILIDDGLLTPSLECRTGRGRVIHGGDRAANKENRRRSRVGASDNREGRDEYVRRVEHNLIRSDQLLAAPMTFRCSARWSRSGC